jgi:sialic acid synthase SpsE
MAYVIAEAGACHDSKMSVMRKMCYDAHEAGADAIKFQWTSNAKEMAARRGKATDHGYEYVYEKYLQWPYAWHEELTKLTNEIGIDYLCTVYLPGDVRLIEPYVERFKISSFESLDYEFIEAHAPYVGPAECRDILISTGMTDSTQLERLVREVLNERLPKECWTLLHCVSSYPAPISELSLRSIYGSWTTAAPMFGFSDHSEPEYCFTGALATAAGADIIEAHFKNNETDFNNPDAPHAMTVEQLTDYVSMIRDAELILGTIENSDDPKQVQESEKEMMRFKIQAPPVKKIPEMFMATTEDIVKRVKEGN